MGREEVDELIAQGREQYLRLLEEAEDILINLDRHSPLAMGEAVQRRQGLIDKLGCLVAQFGDASAEADDRLIGFREFQEDVTKKVMEIDGLCIALAHDKQATLKSKLASLSKSFTASQAYEDRGAAKRRQLNDSI